MIVVLEKCLYLHSYLNFDISLFSKFFYNEPYNEAFVHPAMFSHDNAKRVAIIGGVNSAALREVLKHNYIEKIRWYPTVEGVSDDTCNIFSEEQFDCSDFVGRSQRCDNDEHVEIMTESSFKYHSLEFGEELFDILLIDM